MKNLSLALVVALVVALTACGGGGGNSVTAPPPPPPVPQDISISSNAILPVGLQGQPYSTALTAANGTGALKWSMSAGSGATLFPSGLSIDASTGVVSGTTSFLGTATFIATVTDANSKTASKTFTVTAYGPLTAGTLSNMNGSQFGSVFQVLTSQGGVPPLSYSVTAGSLPPGIRIDNFGRITGTLLKTGVYSAELTIRDSWSTPQTASATFNFTVGASGLFVASNFRGDLVLNRPTAAALFASGGIPPYTFRVSQGTLPQGLSLDGSTGKFSGAPTSTGPTFAVFEVKDSAGTTATTSAGLNVVATGRGRNDTIQTATPLFNSPMFASLSPYIDPPDKAPNAADTDYYKMVSMAGTIVSLSAWPEGGAIDPVLEVVDGNGVRFIACNIPGLSSNNYTSACIGDDDTSGNHAASVSYKVPGTEGFVVTSYIHVLDWRGDARPDMQYRLNFDGNIEPINIRLGATRGTPYSYSVFLGVQSTGAVTWSVNNGALPDGLSLSTAGVISGTATTDGEYSFRLKMVDSSVPPKAYYAFVTMGVGEPVKITSAAVWPTACKGQPYSFTVTTTGGVTPLAVTLNSFNPWPGIVDPQQTGNYSGTPFNIGTFTATLGVRDAAGSTDSQNISLTVQNCP